LSQINGIIPLSLDDYKAFRAKSSFLPENNPKTSDVEEARALDDPGKEEPAPPTPEDQLPPEFKQKIKSNGSNNSTEFAFPDVSNQDFKMMSPREANRVIREYGG